MVDLASGDVLLMHLGMSGSFRVHRENDPHAPGQFHHPRSKDHAHDHVVFHMSSGAAVIFNDPRRFGYMKVIDRSAIEDEPLLQGLGPEPLGNAFDAAMLARSCADKKTSLKAALLDQRVVAGLGNIYVCEALFRAQLSPRRLAATLATKKAWPQIMRGGGRPSMRCSIRQSGPAARRCVTIARPPVSSVISSTRSRSMTAKARNTRPRGAAASSGVLPRTDVRPSGARNARSDIEPGGQLSRHGRACPGHPRLSCFVAQRRGCPGQARASGAMQKARASIGCILHFESDFQDDARWDLRHDPLRRRRW